MIPHRDEILRPAVSTDATAVPRYNLVRSDGTIIEKNVAMRLSNPVAREGTPISKAVLDEMLAASGVTAGTASAYTLAQDEYTLFDGAPVRFRLHTTSGDGATLNINGTGAKPLRDMMGAAMPGGIPAGTWLTAYYSAAAGAYVLAGGEAVRALYGERYTVDDAVAYTKDVPEDALPVAEIGEIGGMTYKVNVGTEANPVYELRSAAATAMVSVGVNLIDTKAFAGGGATVVENNDGTYTITNTTNGAISRGVDYTGKLAAGTHTIRNDSEKLLFVMMASGDYSVGIRNGESKTLHYDGASYLVFRFSDFAKNETAVLKIMLNRGTTAQPYTPYFRDTLLIPEAVRALDGYGWGINADCYNYIDCKNKRFVKRVGRAEDLGTLGWMFNGIDTFYCEIPLKKKGVNNLICGGYDIKGTHFTDMADNSIVGHQDYKVIYIRDSRYTDAATFKTAMSGVMLYYELAEPIITDISDILPADNLLRVEAGGTITPINEYNYAVPTTITYQRDVLANRASIFALEKLRLAMELLAKADLSNVSGTFGGVVKANAAAVSALGTAQVRNVTISSTDLSAGSAALATGSSYHVYS